MTLTTAYAATTDGHIASFDGSAFNAREGLGSKSVVTGDTGVAYGSNLDAGVYTVAEGFMRWPVALPVNEVAVAAVLRLPHTECNGSLARTLSIREYDWGAAVDGADYRPSATFNGLPTLGSATQAHTIGTKTVYAGTSTLAARINTESSVPAVFTHSRAHAVSPTGNEIARIRAAETAGTDSDPALIFTSVPRSTLFGVLGASVQLADGSWVVLESDGAADPVVTLRRHTGSAVATIATLDSNFAATAGTGPNGAAALALATDGTNVWVIGEHGTQSNALAVERYVYSSPGVYTWDPIGSVALPAYALGRINAVAATYHATDTPTIAILVAHAPGQADPSGGGAEVAFVTIPANFTGTTITPITSYSALGTVLPTATDAGRFSTYGNEVGNGLDLVPGSASTGYLASLPKGAILGEAKAIPTCRYDLLPTGAVNSSQFQTSGNSGTKDAGTKVRVVPLSGTAVAVVTADPTAGRGITVQPWQTGQFSWTALAPAVCLDAESIASMPAASALATSSAWDVIYTPYDNKVWVYYPDKTDPRILRRTGVSMSTYQASREETTVATVGAAGGTNLAVRVARNAPVGARNLVTIAHRTAGGALATHYQLDSFAQAPYAPALIPKANYDATAAAVFSWTYQDPNADTQGAYQIQITDPTGTVTAYDSGKVTSAAGSHNLPAATLANGQSYQWRVKTWDAGNLEGAWSGYGTFSTSAGGTVTITDPATDNPAGIITDDYLIKWLVAGTVQASVRVRWVRVSDNAVIGDTGYVPSTATEYLVTDLASDVEYEVQVTVRNSLDVASGTGTRRLTPSYASPEVPILTVADHGGSGYVLLSVANPEPSGDRPDVTSNALFRRPAGTVAWEPLGECEPNGQFRDYTASSGVPYEYMARAYA